MAIAAAVWKLSGITARGSIAAGWRGGGWLLASIVGPDRDETGGVTAAERCLTLRKGEY